MIKGMLLILDDLALKATHKGKDYNKQTKKKQYIDKPSGTLPTFMLINITFIFIYLIHTYIPKSKRNVKKKTKVKKRSLSDVNWIIELYKCRNTRKQLSTWFSLAKMFRL